MRYLNLKHVSLPLQWASTLGSAFCTLLRIARDSLACDLMEPVRPQVDAYLLDWLTPEPLCRDWFFEQRDGNCRLMGSFAVRLSETARTWGRAVGTNRRMGCR